MSDEINVYNLVDNGQPTDPVVSNPEASSTPAVYGPSGETRQPSLNAITEGDVRSIIHDELQHFLGDIRVGSLYSRQAYILDNNGMRLGGVDFATAPFSVDYDGNMKATNGTILGTMQVGNGVTYIVIDGANSLVKSSNYAQGSAGWQIADDGNAEFNNVRARGQISTSTFVKDEVSAVGGQLLVANADVLDADMTALDASTLTIKGDTTFSANDILHIKDGTDEEYLRVTSAASAPTYSVTRDLLAAYGADSNPAWKAGTAVVVEGSSDGASTYSGGFLKLVGAGSEAPRYSVYKRTGVAADAVTEYIGLGNLVGLLDYGSDEYGIVIGTEALGYLAFDPTNGLRSTGKIISQQIFTAGQEMPAGSVGAIESDGSLYRSRLTDFSTKNTEVALATGSSNPYQFKDRIFDVSSTKKAFFYLESGASSTNTFSVVQLTVSPTGSTVSKTQTYINTTGNANRGMDAVMVTSTDAIACWFDGTSGKIYARYLQNLDGTLSMGTVLNVVNVSTNANISIVKVSSTEVLIVYADNSDDITAISVTASGTTLTAGSAFTIASHASYVYKPYFAERFGDTSAYCVYYGDTTNARAYIVAFTYSGGVLTPGTPLAVTVQSNVPQPGQAYLASVDSTTMALATNVDTTGWSPGSGVSIMVQTFDLSGTTLSENTKLLVEQIASTSTSAYWASLTKIAPYTFLLGYSDSTTSTVGRIINIESGVPTAVGSEITHTGITAGNIITPIFCYHSPGRVLMCGTSSTNTYGYAKTIDMTTNYSSVVGAITTAVAATANALAILNGENSSVTGLTTGTEYYADIDGQLTTSAKGGTKRIGVASSSTSVIVQV